MHLFRAQTFALFTLVALLAACSGTTSSGSAPSAGERQPGEALIGKSFGTSNGMKMGFREFDEVAARRGAMAKNLTEEQRKDIVDGLIDEKLLYLKAVKNGVDLDPKIQRMVVNTFLKDHVYKKVRETSPTQDELMAYFEEHKEDFVVPEKRQVKRILIKPRDGEDEAAVAARAQLVRGALSGNGLGDWNGLAAKHSGGPYKERGGDLGYVGNTERPGVDPAVITKAFEHAGVGVTDVFETKEGLNILYVVGIRPRVDRTFNQIKGAVARKAKAERYKAAFENYVTELRNGAKQDINWDAVNSHEVRGKRRLKPPKPVRRDTPVAPSMPAKPETPRTHSERK
jgi:parvulin-like peptidyl-prolyl isomerase